MSSLILLQFILLIISLGMNCTSMDNATMGVDAFVFAQTNSSSEECSENAEIGGRISLLGCERILLPGMSLPSESEISQEVLFPEGLAVYSRGMTVQGRIEIPYVPHKVAPSGSTVCVAPLSLSAFLALDSGNGPLPRPGICSEVLEWKGTGSDKATKVTGLSFSIPEDEMTGKRSGLYAIYALDRNRSLIAPAQAFFLTEGDAVLQAEDRHPSETQSIRINLSSIRDDGRRRLFAAAIMSRKDYDNATIMMIMNESKPWPVLALSSASRAMEIEANPATFQGKLMDLISLMPENSAISMQESTQSSVQLVLLADEAWEKGDYVINCAVYSPGIGIEGIKQKIIEVY